VLLRIEAEPTTTVGQTAALQVAVGEGSMPVRKMFEALVAMKYKGFVDLEYEIHPGDPTPGVISSFAFMRGVLAGMGYPSKG
jgi:sugar phosphate isomerase/epimerase